MLLTVAELKLKSQGLILQLYTRQKETTPSIDEKKNMLSPGIVDANVQKYDMVYYESKSRLNMGMYDNLLQMGSLIY